MLSGNNNVAVIRRILPELVRTHLIGVNWDPETLEGIIRVVREAPQYQKRHENVFSTLRSQLRDIFRGSQWSLLWPFIQGAAKISWSVVVLLVTLPFWTLTITTRAKHAERLFAFLSHGR